MKSKLSGYLREKGDKMIENPKKTRKVIEKASYTINLMPCALMDLHILKCHPPLQIQNPCYFSNK